MSQNRPSQNRRQFLVNLWKAGGALLIGAAVYTGYEALRPLASNAGSGKLQLGDPKSFDTGTATYFPEGRLYVTNAKGDLFALSQKCPHLGCQVPFCESSGRFECPCHGSVFDIGGEWIEGPAPRGWTGTRRRSRTVSSSPTRTRSTADPTTARRSTSLHPRARPA